MKFLYTALLLHCLCMQSLCLTVLWAEVGAYGSLVNWAAVSLVLVGGDHVFHADSDRVQDALELLEGLLREGGLPAQDPGQLHTEQAVVGAAVDQRVTVVVSGQNPVGAGRRVCRRGENSRDMWLT